MWFVICALGWLALLVVWWWTHRNRYWLIETKTAGVVKQKIIRLPLSHVRNLKLRREIKIFNRLCLVMPTVNGVAVFYREQLRALLRNPRHRPSDNPYERLFYGYACDVLAQKTPQEVVQRQLRRNLTFLLAPKRKIVKRIQAVWTRQSYQLYSKPIYKIFNDCFCDPLQPGIVMKQPWQFVVHGSYIKYYNQDLVVKRYAHGYALQAATTQTVTIKVAADKNDFDCVVSRGVVTCKHLTTGEVHTYAVRGDKVRLATSVCAKIDALEIYVTWQGEAKISLDGGDAQWLPLADVAANQRLERIVTAAHQAKFITGERLRARYLAALKVVPSLSCLTKVVVLQNENDFLLAWQSLKDYQRIAELFQGFNLVFVYSGAVPVVEQIIRANVSAQQIKISHEKHLWLYFVDRTVTDPDALYYLTKVAQGGHYVPVEPTPPGLAISHTWPYVKTLTVTNTLAHKMTRNLVVPLIFNQPMVVSAGGTILKAVNLNTGHVSHYVLPVAVHLPNEWITTHVNLPLKVKLAGYETRQFTITRRESNQKVRLTKKDLATALREIQICTDDKKLDAVFAKTVVEGEDPKTLAAVKVAYQNQSRKLLLAALNERHQITVDVWQYLLTQFVGLRVRGDRIFLTPCVNVMGEFTINFECQGQKYAFNTKKNLSRGIKFANINHYGNSNG